MSLIGRRECGKFGADMRWRNCQHRSTSTRAHDNFVFVPMPMHPCIPATPHALHIRSSLRMRSSTHACAPACTREFAHSRTHTRSTHARTLALVGDCVGLARSRFRDESNRFAESERARTRGSRAEVWFAPNSTAPNRLAEVAWVRPYPVGDLRKKNQNLRRTGPSNQKRERI